MVPLAPGTEVDRYVIVRLLGSGGMGEVYEAQDTRLQRRVALKLLRVEEEGEAAEGVTEGTSRLLREARLAAALDHPNVVAVYDAGEVDRPVTLKGMMYLAMELIAGTSLRSYVGDRTIPVEQRIRWLADVARALGSAHARGMVHRDVKPENIMIREDGVVKVLDFGIAKRTTSPVSEHAALSTLTAKGIVLGTPYYMAPEQMRGEPLDGRADQFAWGVTAYELLSGDVPWTAKGDSLKLVAEVLSKDPPFLTEKSADVPIAVASVIRRALAKDREQRYPSMRLLVAALEGRDVEDEKGAGDRRSREEISAAPTERMDASSPANRAAGPGSNSASLPGVQTPRQEEAPGVASGRRARLARAAAGVTVVVALLGIGGWFARGRPAETQNPASTSRTAAPRDCETNKQCVAMHGGAPFVCREDTGTCAALESEDCKVFAEPSDIENDRTVWIGTMFGGPVGDVNPLAIDLARRDFAVTTRGLVANGTIRPLAVLACNDANSERVATHLVRDAHVPAVIGFATDGEILDLAPRLLLPGDVVAVAALGQSSLITGIPQKIPRLIWRLGYGETAAASAIALFVPEYVEPLLRRRSRGKPTRVALLEADGAADGFAEALRREIVFNGRSALENGDGYRQFSYSIDAASSRVSIAPTVMAALVEFAPNVVVYRGKDTVVRELVEVADLRLPDPPVWIAPNELVPEVLRYIGQDAARRVRFFGISRSSATEVNGKLVVHFNEAFSWNRVTPVGAPATAYDAFYMLAYASYALGDAPATGSNLARAFQRLQPPGVRIQVGPSGILDALDALRSGDNVDLDGAAGHLDFDLSTGETSVDLVIQGVDVDGEGRASQGVPSGVLFDASTKRLRGTLKVP